MKTPAPSCSAPTRSNATGPARHRSRVTPAGNTLEMVVRKRKKRATAVSRLTLVACSPADLLLFTQAVEQLTWAIHDLRMVVAAMPRPRVKKPVLANGSPRADQPSLELDAAPLI